MNLKPITDEMPDLWLHGESGGQQLFGGFQAHYHYDKTPLEVLWAVREHLKRKRLFSIAYWEIQAEERSVNSWN